MTKINLALQCLYVAMLSNDHQVTKITQNGGYIVIATISVDLVHRRRNHGFRIDEDGLRLARTTPEKYG